MKKKIPPQKPEPTQIPMNMPPQRKDEICPYCHVKFRTRIIKECSQMCER